MWTGRVVAVMQIVVGVFVMLAPGPRRWLWASLAIFCWGSAARWLAFDAKLSGGRKILGFSMVRGWKFMCIGYIASGGCALIGAFTSTPIVFAWIVTPFVVTWMLMWIYALRQTRQWEAPALGKTASG